jgi:hypothetical protein
MKTTLVVESDVMELFQENVQRTWGKLKGAQSEALREAMILWLSHKGQIIAVSFHDGKRECIGTVEEFFLALRDLVQKKRGIHCNAVVLGREQEAVLSGTLRVLMNVLGQPNAAYVRDTTEDKNIEELSGVDVKLWVRKLFEWEDASERCVELSAEWKDSKLQCILYPSGQIYVGKVHSKLDLQTLLAQSPAQSGRTG